MIPQPKDSEEDESLAVTMQEWLNSLSAFDVRALVILGPGSSRDMRAREVWAAHPFPYLRAASVLASSDEYGASWRASSSPTNAWQNVPQCHEEPGWRTTLVKHGVQALVRCDIAMPFGAGYECVAFVGRELKKDGSEASLIAWALHNVWPVLKQELISSRFGLNERTLSVLRLLAEGYTSKEAAELVGLKERTVHFHLSIVMERVKADNRAAAISRACMLGIL